MSDQLASLIVKIGADISDYTKGIQQATEHLSSLSEHLSEVGEKIGEVALEFLAFESLKKFGEECIEVAASIEKASIAMTHLIGSASAANEVIRQMEDLAKEDAIAFPGLLPAAQRFIAVGFAVEGIRAAMDAAANASWALGTSVDDIAGRMEGMALSGMAGGRQLKTLGINSEEMASVMGVSIGEVQKVFKELDLDTRLQILELAMQRFAGTARAQSDGVIGSWTEVKNAWHGVFAEIGDTISPITKWIEQFAESAGHVTAELLRMKTIIDDLKAGAAGAIAGAAVGAMAGGVGAIPGAIAGGTVGIASSQISRQFFGDQGTPEFPPLKAPASPAPPAEEMVRSQVAAAKAAAETAYALEHQTTALQDAQAWLGKVSEAMKLGLANATDLRIAHEALTAAFQAENPEFEKFDYQALKNTISATNLARAFDTIEQQKGVNFELWVDQFERGDMALPPLIEQSKEFAHVLDGLDKMAADASKSLNSLADAMKALGLSEDGGTKQMAAFDTIVSSLGKGSSLQNVEDGWSRISNAVNKLAQSDLPKAIEEYDKYIATLQKAGAPMGEILAAQQQELQMEINVATMRGDGANKAIIDLTNLQMHTQALAGQTNTLGNAYKGLAQDFTQAFGTLTTNVAQAISHAKSFGDAWKATVQTVEQSILQTIVGAAFGALKDAIVLAIDKIFGIGVATVAAATAAKAATSLIDVAEVAGAAAVGAANVMAWTMAIPFVGPALAPAAGAAALAEFSPLAALASFDVGGWVPDDMVAQVHKGEYINTAAEMRGNVGGTSNSSQSVVIHVHESKNPRDTVRAIAKYMKSASGSFATT